MGNPYRKKTMDRLSKAEDSKLIPAARLLRAWLIKNDMTAPDLARRTGFNPQTLYNYMSGDPVAYPSLAQAFAIEWATNGAVPAYMWLDQPLVKHRIRRSQLAGALSLERSVRAFVLKFNAMKTADGVIRQKARTLSRLFGVSWGEVRQRAWQDAKAKAKKDIYDISYLMKDITDEEAKE